MPTFLALIGQKIAASSLYKTGIHNVYWIEQLSNIHAHHFSFGFPQNGPQVSLTHPTQEDGFTRPRKRGRAPFNINTPIPSGKAA